MTIPLLSLVRHPLAERVQGLVGLAYGTVREGHGLAGGQDGEGSQTDGVVGQNGEEEGDGGSQDLEGGYGGVEEVDEEEVAQREEQQTPLHEVDHLDGHGEGDPVADSASIEDGPLLSQVEQEGAQEGEQQAEGDHGGIQTGGEQHGHHHAVPLPYPVLRLFRRTVQFPLGHHFLSSRYLQ